MSYSRWGGSEFYIFWHVSNARKKDDELLAIWHYNDESLPTFKYSELKDLGFKGFATKFSHLNCLVSELKFAYKITREWIRDVDREYERLDKSKDNDYH